MISKNKIKFLRSLKLKKYREEYHVTLLEGIRLIDESINCNIAIQNIWMTADSIESNPILVNKIKSKNITLDIIEIDDLKSISDTQNSQGAIAEINIKKYLDSKLDNINNNVVILDNISDPGNLGTIFRTCSWYNVRNIILSSNTVDPFNFKSLRSGMGAHFYFDSIVISDNKSIIDFLLQNDFNILCSDLKGDNIANVAIKNKWALVLGSEAHGASTEFNKYHKISIPKFGNIESLNVSVACGIILERLINND